MTYRHPNPVIDHIRQLAGTQPTDQLSDGQLLDRFVSRHEEGAFSALIQRHGPMVHGVCRRVVSNLHDAEDVFQATFLVLARKAASVSKRESVGSWLHGVARRLGSKFKFREMQRHARERRVEAPSAAEPVADLAWRELQALLDAELARLPARYRVPLILCYLEGKTHDDAARQLGCPVGTVHSWLVRGREMLRERLQRKGLTLSATAFAASLALNTATAISPALVERTAQAAMGFALGEASLPAASNTAVLLARAGMRSVLLGRLLLVLGGGLAVTLMAAGAALWGEHLWQTPAGAVAQAAPLAPAPAPKAELPAPTDRFGDPLPDGVMARLGPTRFRLTNSEGPVAFTPDGKGILTGSQRGAVLVWSAESGKVIRRLAGHKGTVATVSLSPDGRLLASAGQDKIIRLWDWPEGKERGVLEGHEHWIDGLAFSSDGNLLASDSWDGTVRVWDVAARKEIHKLHASDALRAGTHISQHVAFSPDGKELASAHGRSGVLVWDVATGKKLREIVSPQQYGVGVAYSPNGKVLATTILDASENPKLRVDLWNSSDGQKLRSLSCGGHASQGFGLLFTPDSQFLIAGGEGASVWEVATGKEQVPVAERCWVSSLAWAPDGKTLVTRGAVLAVFDFANRKKLVAWEGHEGKISSLALSPDGKMLASSAEDSAIRLWAMPAGREVARLTDGSAGARHLAWSADGQRLVAAGSDGVLRVWDVAREKLERQFSLEVKVLDVVGLAPAGDTAAVFAWDFLKGRAHTTLWNVATGKKLRQLEMVAGNLVGPAAATFSPDGSVLACSMSDGTIYLWDVATGNKLGECDGGGKDALGNVIFAPDGRSLVSIPIETMGQDERVIRLWDVATGKEVRQFRGSVRWVTGAAFSRDGRTLFTGSVDGSLRLWEVATGKQRAVLKGDQPMISCVAFAANGSFLLSGSHDSTILLWNAQHVFRSPAGAAATDRWEELWRELASDDAELAYQSAGRLSLAAQTVARLNALLQPVAPADADRVKALIDSLGSEQFVVRQRASQDLEALGDLAEPALRRRLNETPPLETRQRIDGLLVKLPVRPLSTEELRTWRAIEVLERIGTPAARQVLERLAAGAPEARLARAAKASVQRMKRE